MAITLRVREVEVFLRRVRTRIPFRYGKAVVTGQPYAHLRVRFDPGGTGVSASALPPLWFDKRPGLTHDETIRSLLRSISIAASLYRNSPASTPRGLHELCEPEARRQGAREGLNDLTAGFGVALLDLAVLDAACRKAGRTFHQGLREDLFGMGPELAALVPPRPLPRIEVRHTVGLADPITAVDLTPPLGDGLPESLDQVIQAYRVSWFKVKISGDVAASLDRLRRIASVLKAAAGEYRITLDGNEQFPRMEEASEFLRRLAADHDLRDLWQRTAWIEQPVDRSASLDGAASAALRTIPKPVIIDEADGSDDAVDRALGLGYAGISAKNCKGVFRTLHSFRKIRPSGAILSSEDLMNIPVVPLHQDLSVAAALHLAHSERNGHHYIRGLDYFSPSERDTARREFPELYRPGRPTVWVEDGSIDLSGINAFGLGVRSEPDWAGLEPAPLP